MIINLSIAIYADITLSKWDIAAKVYELVHKFKSRNCWFLFKSYELYFICIHIEANASCCLLPGIQLGFGLSWC